MYIVNGMTCNLMEGEKDAGNQWMSMILFIFFLHVVPDMLFIIGKKQAVDRS
jgi:hypothetical protein